MMDIWTELFSDLEATWYVILGTKSFPVAQITNRDKFEVQANLMWTKGKYSGAPIPIEANPAKIKPPATYYISLLTPFLTLSCSICTINILDKNKSFISITFQRPSCFCQPAIVYYLKKQLSSDIQGN